MRKYAFCCQEGCGIPIIGSRVEWASPICVGCLPPPPPLKKVSISQMMRDKLRRKFNDLRV